MTRKGYWDDKRGKTGTTKKGATWMTKKGYRDNKKGALR